jgi:hypothetical protein
MDMIVGNKYKWKCGPEILTYLGYNWSGNGYWHQFALVEKPDEVWCEVLGCDLHMLEEVKPKLSSYQIRAISEWATRDTPRMRKIALKPRNDPPEVQQAAMSAAEEKRQRRAERNKRIATQERQP